MAKINTTKVINEESESGFCVGYVSFTCPGCKGLHQVPVHEKTRESAIWGFNGDVDKPTLVPSLLVRWTDGKFDDKGMPIAETVRNIVCHSFITNGNIQFLSDCTHDLKNQTIELPEIV